MFPIQVSRGIACVFIIPWVVLVPIAGADTPPDDFLDELSKAAANGDTSSITYWIRTHPDRVYLETMRLALSAVGKASGDEDGGAADLRSAGIIAQQYRRRTGRRALADLVNLYASYDSEQAAEHALADSLYREGDALYHGGQHTESLDLFLRALARHQILGDRRSEGLDYTKIAALLDAVGETARARRYAAEAIEIGEEIGCAACLGSGFHALGGIELGANNLQQAIEAFRRTRRIGLALGESNYVAAALGMLANAYYLAGRYYESLAMHEEALDLFRRIGHPRGQVSELINIAHIYTTDLTQYEDATRSLEEAIDTSVREGYPDMEACARGSLARVLWARGLHREALETLSSAMPFLEAGDDAEQYAVALAERGGILRAAGQTEEARRELERALDIAGAGISPFALCEILAELALTETLLGHPHNGLSHAMEAIELFEATRRRIEVEELRAGSLYLRTYIYEAALLPLFLLDRASPDQGFAEDAFRLVEDCRSGTFLDFHAARSGQEQGGQRPARAALAKELSLLQLALLASLDDDEQRSAVRHRIRGVRARLDSLEMATHRDSPIISMDGALTASAIRCELRPGKDLLLEFFWGREAVYGWGLTRGRIRFFRVGQVADVEGLVAVFSCLLRDTGRAPFDSPAAFRLSGVLLDPVSDLMHPAERLIVVPDGPLLGIPFETLPCPVDIRREALEISPDEPWQFLIEHFEVCNAVSASLWRYLTTLARGPTRATRELIAFGDPNLEYEAAGRHWARLAYSGSEIRELDRILSPRRTRILRAEEASEDHVKEEAAGSYEVLHFATHACASNVDPSASGLLLAPSGNNDGFLTSLEILGLDLAADLVTLSACQTGRGRLVSGEGILGLSRAFFYAGSTSVLASLWEVDDAHTARFMGRFYRHLVGGASKGEALALTKRECISGEHGLSPHPCFWAPFVILGDADGTLSLTPRAWYEQAIAWPILGFVLAGILAVGRFATIGRRRSGTIPRN
ncbi:MAG: tetratricopeptide repeat protein [Candidatus Eisenbacteria sp.]|nr:tetratricopeptide repeat protein [Candidatus Eisenbacteria bacterium]